MSDFQKARFETARESMVVSQLQPSGIVSESVMRAYREIPREDFVPENLRSVCYLDESLQLGNSRILLEPMLHGLMVEELAVTSNDRALDIGDVSGYSAAILSRLAREVVVAEEAGDDYIVEAKKAWLTLGYDNILSQNAPEGEFDVILLNGAVAEIPDSFVAKLSPGGRLGCILQPGNKTVGKIAIVTREENGTVSKRLLEDASSSYIRGFEPKAGFVF